MLLRRRRCLQQLTIDEQSVSSLGKWIKQNRCAWNSIHSAFPGYGVLVAADRGQCGEISGSKR